MVSEANLETGALQLQSITHSKFRGQMQILVDRMHCGWLPLNAVCHVIISVLLH